jgi:hypothetical protein
MKTILQILGVLFIVLLLGVGGLFLYGKSQNSKYKVFREMCRNQVLQEGKSKVSNTLDTATKGADGTYYSNNVNDFVGLATLKETLRDSYKKCLTSKGINEPTAEIYTAADF